MEMLADDGDQEVNAGGDPQLRLDGVLRRAQKRLDPQVLFDPFEKQFDFPSILVEAGNLKRSKFIIVCKKNKSLSGCFINVLDSS